MDDVAVVQARHKLDVDDYYRMGEAGILGEDDRVELIDGDIIDMAPIGQGHEATVNGLNKRLVLACMDDAIVSVQNSIRLGRRSAPQPDLAILRNRDDYYATGERAGPDDVLLLIEVADSSLQYDRTVKLPLYARAGIAELWIVDLQRGVVEAHRAPSEEGYRETTTYQRGEQVALALVPEIVLKLDVIFG